MTKTIAICTQAEVFNKNQVLDPAIAVKYPGALWISKLCYQLDLLGVNIMTGDVALCKVKSGVLKPSDVWVIQEDQSKIASDLIKYGGIPKILYCCESPLFAPDFYANLPKLSIIFEYCLLFRGVLNDANPQKEKHVLFFPSFEIERSVKHILWEERKFLVMVTGNKYWKIYRPFWQKILAKARDQIRKNPKQHSNPYEAKQLHDKRLELIEYFGARDLINLYGDKWGKINNLPIKWIKKLKPIIKRLNPKICDNKQDLISKYKFAICFENIEFPGYVTEKIFDALVAGVIPVYLGATDIKDFVPEQCYIDTRNFESLTALCTFLLELTEKDGMAIINMGQEYLNGDDAKKYTHEGFAERVLKLLYN